MLKSGASRNWTTVRVFARPIYNSWTARFFMGTFGNGIQRGSAISPSEMVSQSRGLRDHLSSKINRLKTEHGLMDASHYAASPIETLQAQKRKEAFHLQRLQRTAVEHVLANRRLIAPFLETCVEVTHTWAPKWQCPDKNATLIG